MIRNYRRLTLFVTLAIVTFGPASAGPRNANIAIGGQELPLIPRAVVDDGAVYAPIPVLDYLGFAYSVDDDGHSVNIVTSKLKEKTVSTVALGDHNMLPMAQVVEIVGGMPEWNEFTRTLNIFSQLKSVEFANRRLIINLTIPVPYKMSYLSNPERLSIDIPGAKLSTTANEVFIGTEDVRRARLGQFDDRTARVVLDLTRRVGYKVLSENFSKRIEIEVGAGIEAPQPVSQPAQASSEIVNIMGITTDSIDDRRLRVNIAASGTPNCKYTLLSSPPRLAIDIARARLGTEVTEIPLAHPLVEKIRLGQQGAQTNVRIVLDFTRYLAYSVVSVDEAGVVVEVRLPPGAGGKLGEKIIVIDPGHGGPYRGASHGGVHEKTLTLQFSQKLARRLEALGNRVILTRTGDYTLDSDLREDLRRRAVIADEQGADLFISIHCNALGTRTPPSGTETYYRQNRWDSFAFAGAIHEKVIKGTGMTCRGVRPDSQLFKGRGLAVLRQSSVPAILIETGYMDNRADLQRLVNPDFQEKFAAALVEGLRFYVEGTRTGGEP